MHVRGDLIGLFVVQLCHAPVLVLPTPSARPCAARPYYPSHAPPNLLLQYVDTTTAPPALSLDATGVFPLRMEAKGCVRGVDPVRVAC